MVSSPVLEALEQRALLAAPFDFAGVGVRFDASVTSVLSMTGQLAADNTVTGTQVRAGLVGLPVTGPLDLATIERLSPGRILTTPRSGVDPYASQVGANFLSELGYGFGSFFGQQAGAGGAADVDYLLPRPYSSARSRKRP